jgi:hypothetical protein
MLNIGYAAGFPRGAYVKDISHLRGGKSLLTVLANDPGLSYNLISSLGKRFDNVELLNIKSPKGTDTVSTFEIAFDIK